MKIYCDTREQQCLKFEVGDGISEVIHTKLPYGDYACGWEDRSGKHIEFMPIFFERKGLGDLYGTLTSGMERFKREIERAKEDGVKLIIIVEACLAEVLNGTTHSSVPGSQIIRTLHTLWVKHDVPYILCNDRDDMIRTITEMFSAVGRNFKPRGDKHEETRTSQNTSTEISPRTRQRLVGESEHFGLRDDSEADLDGQTFIP